MIASMTGFGRGTAQIEQVSVTVELRSVNNRFCEVSARLPQSLSAHESEVQTLIKSNFDRGRIYVNVQLEKTSEDVLPIDVDLEAARAYGQLLERLREAVQIDEPVRLEHVLRFSEVFTIPEEPDDQENTAWEAAKAALVAAIEKLRTMRREEGRALEAELLARLDDMAQDLTLVETHAPERLVQARERLYARLEEFFTDERLDRDRLEQEITLLADKLDVTEECVRLHSHIQLFREAIANNDAVGRKLNFIAQEMNREVNTIGSKANNAEIAHVVVQMKETLEKIREQVQNVE